MEAFKQYLQQKRYRDNTINEHLKNLNLFTNWIATNELQEIENISYNNLLAYVQYEKAKGIDVATINLRISSVRKYFEYLQSKGMASSNPARTLRIKGKANTVTENPLPYNELEKLYHAYKALEKQSVRTIQDTTAMVHQRNIIIVGLLIWQGLHSGEIATLETMHINLNEGTIYIPSTTRSNSRTLPLHMQQVLTLHNYIHGGVRDKLNPNGEKLIAGNVYNVVCAMMEEIKGINPQIKNAQHIRASVLLQWLKQHNKRQVQYMVGHKHIGSTEKYEREALTSVTEGLTKHHPFG
jgi:site-specific recombinase XerD